MGVCFIKSNFSTSWVAQARVLTGRTGVEAETPMFWPPDAKSWLIGKDSDAGKDWGQEEKGTTEDEMAGWHYQLDGHGSGWIPGVGDRQRGLACFSPWGHKDRTRLSYWTELNWTGGSDGKESACNAGDVGLSLSWDDPLEENMATGSSILAWRIPQTEEPGGLQSIGSQSRTRLSDTYTHKKKPERLSIVGSKFSLLRIMPILFFITCLALPNCYLQISRSIQSELMPKESTWKSWVKNKACRNFYSCLSKLERVR